MDYFDTLLEVNSFSYSYSLTNDGGLIYAHNPIEPNLNKYVFKTLWKDFEYVEFELEIPTVGSLEFLIWSNKFKKLLIVKRETNLETNITTYYLFVYDQILDEITDTGNVIRDINYPTVNGVTYNKIYIGANKSSLIMIPDGYRLELSDAFHSQQYGLVEIALLFKVIYINFVKGKLIISESDLFPNPPTEEGTLFNPYEYKFLFLPENFIPSPDPNIDIVYMDIRNGVNFSGVGMKSNNADPDPLAELTYCSTPYGITKKIDKRRFNYDMGQPPNGIYSALYREFKDSVEEPGYLEKSIWHYDIANRFFIVGASGPNNRFELTGNKFYGLDIFSGSNRFTNIGVKNTIMEYADGKYCDISTANGGFYFYFPNSRDGSFALRFSADVDGERKYFALINSIRLNLYTFKKFKFFECDNYTKLI